MDDFYREELLDHYDSSPFRGRLANPTASADMVNPLCGDTIHVDIELDPDGRIRTFRFDGNGCVISQAGTSLLAESLEGRTAEEARTLTPEDMVKLLQIPLTPARLKCALLGWKALQQALARHRRDRGELV
jgi:nitrogen fixation NifU-like protein